MDKGYNATPTWNMIASIISNRVPLNELNLKYLVSIDLVLMLIAFVFVAYAFGVEMALLTAIVFFASYPLQPPHIRGAFMRYDWVAALMVSISLLKLKKYAGSGAVLAFSVSARVFPVLLVAGLGFRLLLSLVQKKADLRNYFSFFTALALVLALLSLASVAYNGNTHSWEEFISKIGLHNDDISSTRVGLKYVLLNRGETSDYDFEKQYGNYNWGKITSAKKRLWSTMKPVYLCLALFLLALWLLSQRKLEDHESLAYAFPLIFIFSAPTFYYYIAFSVFPLAFADRKERFFLTSLALMVLCWMALFVINNNVAYWWFAFFLMSAAFLTAILIVIILLAIDDPATKKNAVAICNKMFKPAAERKPVKNRKAFLGGVFLLLILSLAAVKFCFLSPEKISDGLPVAEDDGSKAVFVAGGDLNLGRNIERVYKQNGAEYVAEGLLPELKGADLVFANLECVLTKHEEKRPKKGTPVFHIKGDPSMSALLVDMGVDVVSLANNHTMDYGCEGMKDMLEALDRTGIKYGGAGVDAKSASEPTIADAGGIKIGFLYYTPLSADATASAKLCGLNRLSLNPKVIKASYKRLRKEVRELRKKTDLVFVSIHWGVNYTTEVRSYMVDFAHKAIEAGAHGVLGHHAHQFLGMDSYAGRPILYDMGNLLFDSMNKPWLNRQGLFRMELSKQGVKSVEFMPYYFKHPERRAIKAASELRSQTLKRMQELSEKNGGETELRGDRLFLKLK